MDDLGTGKALVYNSNNMVERRLRVLREARRMIAASDSTEFSVDELCARADVAKSTVYKAFGSKDHIIALAIQQYMDDYASKVQFELAADTIEGRLERLIKSGTGMLRIRSYTTAIQAIHSAPATHRAIRAAIRRISSESNRPLLQVMHEEGGLDAGVTVEKVSETITSAMYALQSDWSHGDLADNEVVERFCEVYLLILMGFSSGRWRERSERWLHMLRHRTPEWERLWSLALGEISARGSQRPKPKDRRSVG